MTEAGLYLVASSAMILPGMAGTIITIMPAVAVRLYQESRMEQLQRPATVSCVAWTLPTIDIALVLWLFREQLLQFAFGADFKPEWLALAVLTGDSVIIALGVVSITMLHAERKESVVTWAFGLSLVISVGGSLWLAARMGALGVAAAVLAATIVRTAYLAQANRRFVGIYPTLLGAAKFRFR